MSTPQRAPLPDSDRPLAGARPPAAVKEQELRGLRLVLGGMILAIVLTCAYWLIWFGVDRNILASSHAGSYYTFENAFPLADGWLVLTLLLGVVGLARRRPFGLLATLLAGGAGVYLGCMDVLFDLENHIYVVPQSGDASGPFIEITINVLTFMLAILIITWVWRHRSWFLTGSPLGR
jgi:hypothetical protein